MELSWNGIPANLKGIRLTADQKNWLADQVVVGQIPCVKVARHFQVNHNTLKYYVART